MLAPDVRYIVLHFSTWGKEYEELSLVRTLLQSISVKNQLISNPSAGPWDLSNLLQYTLSGFESHWGAVPSSITHQPGDTTRLAKAAVRNGCDLVLVSGGDGTVNEAVDGLVGTQTALGTTQVGTGNMWARQLGFHSHTLANPFRFPEVADSLARGTVRTVDVGIANGRYFLCGTGIGPDSQIAAEMEPRPRYAKRLGGLPCVVAALNVAGDFPGIRARTRSYWFATSGSTAAGLILPPMGEWMTAFWMVSSSRDRGSSTRCVTSCGF